MRRAHSKVLIRRTVAVELAPDGITANAVAPDPNETELFRENNPKGGEGRSVIWPECRWGDCFRISPDVITVVQPGNEGGDERSLIQLAGSIIFAAGYVVPSGFTVVASEHVTSNAPCASSQSQASGITCWPISTFLL